MSAGITKNILRFNVSMTNSFRVNIRNRPHQLVRIEFYNQIRNHLLHFQVLFHHTVCSVWDVVHNHIQIYLFWFVSICIETLPHLDTVGMVEHFQNGEFSVFVPLVLKNLFDSNSLTSFSNSCLEHNSKRSVTNDLLSIVSIALLLLLFSLSLIVVFHF